jgi:uncharacterized membrane protein
LIHVRSFSTLHAMDNKKRTWTKALTWQAIGLLMMTTVNYFYLGNFHQGVGLSLLLTVQGLLTYVVHERLWARVRWGRSGAPETGTP